MATFTMPLKKVIELTGGNVEYDSVTFNNIEYGKLPILTDGNIGLTHYPLFNEEYRPILNGKIIDHYWNREIGLETIDLFQLAMRRKMNEIMPYYNQLYKSELIEYDALSTMDISTDSTSSVEATEDSSSATSADSETDSNSRAVNSTTPQMNLAGNEDYASGIADAVSKSTVDSTATQESDAHTVTDVENSSRTRGFQARSASDLILHYRETFLNIDMMIINEIVDCFMLVFDNGDSYFNEGYLI